MTKATRLKGVKVSLDLSSVTARQQWLC